MKATQKRFVKFGIIIIATIIALTLSIAPQNSKSSDGSTYGKSPDGYSAWYAFMAARGTPVERWQKAISNLAETYNSDRHTLVIISPDLRKQSLPDRKWIERGNHVVVLGDRQNPTPAKFDSIYNLGSGSIKIETTRRNPEAVSSALKDEFGSIVWSEVVGEGKIIYSATPYLAANAYQDFPGNYNLLAKLVTEGGRKVLVDEYIHGYKDSQVTSGSKVKTTLDRYLAATPLMPAFIQTLIVLTAAIIGYNFRFGRPETLSNPTLNNSQVYIQALASVLQKAQTNKFVIETITKAEIKQLQRKLGLGSDPVGEDRLIEAWKQQTGQPVERLQEVMQSDRQKNTSESDLAVWLAKWQEINRQLFKRG